MGAAERGRNVRDWAVALGAAVVLSVRVSVGPEADVSSMGQAPTSLAAVVVGGALLWRRKRPWVVAAVAVIASLVLALIAGPVVPDAGWLAVVVLARHVPDLRIAVRGAVAAALGVVLGSAIGALVHGRTSSLPLVVSLTVVVLLAAVLVRLQSARVQTQRSQREAERKEAIADERLRIARDMHDLVGHGLSMIAVQSGAARLALDAGDPATARRALDAVEQASRGALTEMRQLLGVLRPGEADAAPTPGLDRLDTLVQDARAAGHRVTVDRSGPLDAVPAVAGLTAYRVLQEALTNAIRHAAGAPIAIILRASDDLTIEVSDSGTGGGAQSDRPSYGLLGLQERIAAAGGTLEAGPRDDVQGWRE
ncbi:sensor histidine kinase [Kribbella sp. NPDC023972]|uniref:sensor histidine kinase n=1 Tax=Kribbella sp. NPDC023972 TaxID=3154795 RepID=UPI00340D074C